ncbi:MAG: hypothetical protein ACJAZS_000391 [Alteromonas naphthalenivorans]|jgi:hypothetical protein
MIKKNILTLIFIILFPATATNIHDRDIHALMQNTDFMQEVLTSPETLTPLIDLTISTPNPKLKPQPKMRGKDMELLNAKLTIKKNCIAKATSRGKDIKLLKAKMSKSRNHMCKLCNACYKSSSALNFHRQKKHGKPWPCLDCKNIYPASSSLLLHLKNVHPEQRSNDRLQCEYGCIRQIHWPAVMAHHKLVCKKDPNLK